MPPSRPTGVERNLRNGDLRVICFHRQVFIKEQEIHLTPIEYRLLSVLIANAGRVVTYQQLFTDVWGPGKVDQHHHVRRISLI